MTPRFFYVEDDTAVLFAGNGTALAALLVGMSDLVPLLKYTVPTFPMWMYFIGLIFAFLAKLMVQFINDDTLQREKLQYMRDLIIESRANQDLDDALTKQFDDSWAHAEAQYGKLLKPNNALKLAKLRAMFFVASAVCFLIATWSLIHLAGELSP